MQLAEIIKGRIQKEGPISFRDFMEMALYYPELGYYDSKKDKIGANGDFYTSPYLSASFGAMIARQMEEMWQLLEEKPFKIIEYGAGTGLLCYDILNYLKHHSPKFYDNLTYYIIEKSAGMRKIEHKYLREKVVWANQIEEIPEIDGCVLSNELVDNLAVHQVVMREELNEIFVDCKDGNLIEIFKPASSELKQYFSELNIKLPYGFRTEANLEAVNWMHHIGDSLHKGYVMTIDYGELSTDLYNIRRRFGTLLCYNRHKRNDNPYQDIGNQDITTHTNFSALYHWGHQYGLDYCGMVNQANFLLGLGIKEYDEEISKNIPSDLKSLKQKNMITQTLLIDMGLKFKVLIQRKEIQNYPLKGLQFLNLPESFLA